jgi:RHS repeat-associated protein
MKRIVLVVLVCVATNVAAQTHTNYFTRDGAWANPGAQQLGGGNDGAASWAYPFSLPPSRGRYQPSLGLSYSSNNQADTGYGVGWSLAVGYIEVSRRSRFTDTNPPTRTEQFWVAGDPDGLLVSVATNAYRVDVEKAYFHFTANRPNPLNLPIDWSAVDALGTTYQYTCVARTTCNRWYLTRATDVDGNVVIYDYTAEGGASAQLTSIQYNNYQSGGTQYATKVNLVYRSISGAATQPDVVAGTFVSHTQHLTDVYLYTNANGYPSTSYSFHHNITYETSPETRRAEPTAITLTGYQGFASLRATHFKYGGRFDNGTNSTSAFMSGVVLSNMPAAAVTATAAWIDIDGDRRADLVWGGNGTAISWAQNTSSAGSTNVTFGSVHTLFSRTFAGPIQFSNPTGESYRWRPGGGLGVQRARLMDMNGDGRPDLVAGPGTGGCMSTYLEIHFNIGAGGAAHFDSNPTCMQASAPLSNPAWGVFKGLSRSLPDTDIDLNDLTGDGIPDYIFSAAGDWTVYPGIKNPNGSWQFASNPIHFHPHDTSNGSPIRFLDSNKGQVLADIVDMNGDGLPDRVVSSIVSGAGIWSVDYNTGSDFATNAAFVKGDTKVQAVLETWFDSDFFNYPASRGVLMDLNGDARPDYLFKSDSGANMVVSWNTGATFDSSKTTLTLPADVFPSMSRDVGQPDRSLLADVDGDGFPDFVYHTTQWLWAKGTVASRPANRADLLVSVIDPLAKQTQLAYSPSTAMGNGFGGEEVAPVVTAATITGPQLGSLTLRFYYGTPVLRPFWYDDLRLENLGFQDSWTYNATSQLGTHNQWSQQHVFLGNATLSESGSATYAPPVITVTPNKATQLTLKARQYSGAACDSADPGPGHESDYPVIPFPTSVYENTIQSGTTLSKLTTIACSAVSPYGNVADRVHYLDYWEGSTLPYYEHIDFDSGSSCKSCSVRTRLASDQGLTQILADAYQHYDSALPVNTGDRLHAHNGHLTYIERWNSTTGQYEVDGQTAYQANGLVSFRQTVAVTSPRIPAVTITKTYDIYQLRETQSDTSDGTTTLRTTTTYDTNTGFAKSVTGPFLTTRTSVTAKGFLYDGLGRPLAVVRLPPGSTPPAYGATSVAHAIETFEYKDNPSDAMGQERWHYSFASDLSSISIPFSGVDPSRNDVSLSTGFVDGMGRTIQVRERMGAGASGPSDPAAQVVQNLSEYRVSKAVVFDAAGQVRMNLLPFFSTQSGYQDYRTKNSDLSTWGLQGEVLAFDEFGRTTCSIVKPVTASIPSNSPCTSSPAENSSYAKATAFAYGMNQINGTGRYYFTIDTTVPRENVSRGLATRVYFDGSGQEIYRRDTYQNVRQTMRDVLGRPTDLIRSAPGYSATVAVHYDYDTVGRVTHKHDSSAGDEVFAYLVTGQLLDHGYAPNGSVPGGTLGVHYVYGTLGRLTEVDHFSWAQVGGNWRETFTWKRKYFYDQAVNAADRTVYLNCDGRPCEADSPDVTTLLGYTTDGFLAKKGVTFNDLGQATVTRTLRNDGLVTRTVVTAPGNTSSATYYTSYDSARQVVKLDDAGSTQYWNATFSNPPVGAPENGYDGRGRLITSYQDWITGQNGGNPWNITHAPNLQYTQKPDFRTIATYFSATKSYYYSLSNSFSWLAGDQMNTMIDTTLYPDGSTTYSYQYDHDGRLTQANATDNIHSVVSEDYNEQYSPFVDKSLGSPSAPKGSFSNIEKVRLSPAGPIATYTYPSALTIGTNPELLQNITWSMGSTNVDGYRYDARGLVTSHTLNGNTVDTYSYDGELRLTTVTSGSTTENDAYDGDGVLAKRTFVGARGFQELYRYYLGEDATVSVTALGTVSTKFNILLHGTRIAHKDGSLVVYYHRNFQGSVVATTTGEGVAGALYRFGPYGAVTKVYNETSSNKSDLGYTGARTLTGGLVYLRARVYDPFMRRFLQPDSLDGLRYTYASGDPINRIDPTGHGPNLRARFNPDTPGGGAPDRMWLKLAWMDEWRAGGMRFEESLYRHDQVALYYQILQSALTRAWGRDLEPLNNLFDLTVDDEDVSSHEGTAKWFGSLLNLAVTANQAPTSTAVLSTAGKRTLDDIRLKVEHMNVVDVFLSVGIVLGSGEGNVVAIVDANDFGDALEHTNVILRSQIKQDIELLMITDAWNSMSREEHTYWANWLAALNKSGV